jgi:hypothetical protein
METMHALLTPMCPKCGNSTPEQLSERRDESSRELFAPGVAAINKTTGVYRCQCGTTFTHVVDAGDLLRKSIAAQAGDERETLFAKANRLQREVGQLVDNPSCLIVGYDGEACIAKLRTTAQQCKAEGLHETARRLDQLARDVMRRWAE